MSLKKTTWIKHLTKGEITAHAIEYFTLIGFDCWPENNTTPVRHRHFTGRKGKPDIIGFGANYMGTGVGIFLGCEVKTINDTFSDDQIIFLNNLEAAGGAAYVAYQGKDGKLKIEKWQQRPLPQKKPIGLKKISNSTKSQKSQKN